MAHQWAFSTGLLAIFLIETSGALAQPYPAKPVRIIAGFLPGGFADTSSRIVAQQLTAAWGQQVIVENRAGANGLIAGDMTAKSAPDGHALFMSSAGLTINPMLYTRQQRDPLKDFTAVSLVAGIPNVLVVHPSVPAKNVTELLAIARSKAGTLTQATAGTGSPGHLSGELLQQIAQVKFIHVPYKGSSPALVDIMGGQVDLSFPSISSSVSLVKGRKLRGVGVTMAKRSPLLPEVPAVAETFRGFDIPTWSGMFAPAATPRDVIAKLNADFGKVLARTDVKERFAQQGAEATPSTPEALADHVRKETVMYATVIRAAKIVAE